MFPPEATDEQLYAPAMDITDQAEADTYFEQLVNHIMVQWQKSHKAAEGIVRHNLGYYAGYYSAETRARVERLFQCAHPYFGAIAKVGPLSQDRMLEIGIELGEQARRRRMDER